MIICRYSIRVHLGQESHHLIKNLSIVLFTPLFRTEMNIISSPSYRSDEGLDRESSGAFSHYGRQLHSGGHRLLPSAPHRQDIQGKDKLGATLVAPELPVFSHYQLLPSQQFSHAVLPVVLICTTRITLFIFLIRFENVTGRE